jgi:cell division protein FtsI/penicillin-binding protein 2
MRINVAITIILIVVIATFALLGTRLLYLQKFKTEEFEIKSETLQRAIISIKPPRGSIVDRNNNILAASNTVEVVFAEPRLLSDPESTKTIAEKLQKILGMPGYEICGIIYKSKNPGYVKIKEGITRVQRDAIYEGIRSGSLRGVGLKTKWQRHYPTGSLMSHIVGYTGYEQEGLEGLELKFNSKLKGGSGRDIFRVDAHRKPLGLEHSVGDMKKGDSLILTVDSTIQEFTRSALIEQWKAFQAESATAVVMDPRSGAILSLVSIPDYDPTNYSKATDSMRRNRALTDPFEPGSIFKPIVATIGIDAGAIGFNDSFYCEMGHYSGKKFGKIGEWGNHRFANLNVSGILVRSSNIGMAKMGQKMGRRVLYDGIKLFGFGSKTGIDLPGEASGVVRDLKKWDGYSIRVSFGHEVSVTAIQMIRAYAILANGGSAITPHIVRAIVNGDGEITELKRPVLSGYVIKPEVANWMVNTPLVGVVKDKEGTGKETALEDWQVFGKTGTANISGRGGYDERNYVASFAGGVPAENPKIVVLVSIRKPNKSLGKGYSGGRVAAPVVKQILEKTMTYLQ